VSSLLSSLLLFLYNLSCNYFSPPYSSLSLSSLLYSSSLFSLLPSYSTLCFLLPIFPLHFYLSSFPLSLPHFQFSSLSSALRMIVDSTHKTFTTQRKRTVRTTSTVPTKQLNTTTPLNAGTLHTLTIPDKHSFVCDLLWQEFDLIILMFLLFITYVQISGNIRRNSR
jgi:hypothetical protein